MGTTQITNTLDRAAVQALLKSPQGGVVKDLLRRGLKVQSAAKRNLRSSPTRVNTGRLSNSIVFRLVTYQGDPAVRVGTSVFYALYVHEGTGLYGPRHMRIHPINKKVLRWQKRGGRGKSKKGWTYSMYSSGMKPNAFLKNALTAVKD